MHERNVSEEIKKKLMEKLAKKMLEVKQSILEERDKNNPKITPHDTRNKP